ncbi:MAG: hypothetical protein HQK75_12810 [Candidatus Magnetomorum sp.]|nr:hypothetical protein [Candidatus Magnetomorum sp.]
MKKFLCASMFILLCTLCVYQTAYSDEMSRRAYETAHATYQLQLSARLLEHAINAYNPISNPQGASAVLSAFDQLANAFVQADLIVGSYMDAIKQLYPQPHPYYGVAVQISEQLATAVQSVTLLQTISKGAASAGLSSYNKITDIQDIISHAGALACASSIVTNLEPLALPDEDLLVVKHTVYQATQQAALAAIYKKAGTSTVIVNSDACMAAAGAVSSIATYVDGAIAIALPQYMYQSIPFSNAFSSAFSTVMADSKKNPKSFEDQQKTYATFFSPVFAASFSALINQTALTPFQSPVYTDATQTNAEKLIEGAKALSQGIAQILLPGSTDIVDAMNYTTVKNSGFLTERKLELHDLIYALQKLSGSE